jgi:hypothetical protein
MAAGQVPDPFEPSRKALDSLRRSTDLSRVLERFARNYQPLDVSRVLEQFAASYAPVDTSRVLEQLARSYNAVDVSDIAAQVVEGYRIAGVAGASDVIAAAELVAQEADDGDAAWRGLAGWLAARPRGAQLAMLPAALDLVVAFSYVAERRRGRIFQTRSR